MKLKIEKWVEEIKPFTNQAKELFDESVLCYKIGAYKSAFIMSYLAFKLTIRERITECIYRPKDFTEKDWNDNILKDLQNDDKWEKQVNQIIEAAPDAKVKRAIISFENREQAKNEYIYWKNIRNNCAHAKGHIVDSSTIECFWNYLQDNLSKFYVLGGKEYLLKELLEYYKYSHIIDYEKKRHLLYDIKTVYGSNTDEFFAKYIREFELNNQMIIDETNIGFWKDIVLSSYNDIQNGIVKAICTEQVYFVEFYNSFPNILELAIGIDHKFIIDKLSLWLSKWNFNRKINKCFWNLLCEVLQKHRDEINVDKITVNENNMELIRYFECNDKQIKIFNENNIFKKFIINKGGWFFDTSASSQWSNYAKDEEIILTFFNYLDFDNEMLEKINYVIGELNESMKMRSNSASISNGRRFSYAYKKIILDNKDRIEKYLFQMNEKLEKYENIFSIINEDK